MMASYYEEEMARLKREAETERKMEEYNKCSKDLHMCYRSLVNAGFTEEQAWEIFMTLNKGNK